MESKCTRNKRIAKEVIKKKLENDNPNLDYEEYMESIKGLKFYYDQKYKDSLFRQLTRMIFISECGYHDEICNIRYCPPHWIFEIKSLVAFEYISFKYTIPNQYK